MFLIQILQGENLTNRLDVADPQTGNRLLHVAITLPNAEVVKFLLKQKADYLLMNSANHLPLHLAIRRDDIEFVDAFIRFDPDLLSVKLLKTGNATAVRFGHEEGMTDQGESLLHCAVHFNSVKTVQYLVDQDPSCVNELCNYGKICQASVIHLAIAAKQKITEEKAKPVQDNDEARNGSLDQRDQTIGMIKLFLAHCSKDVLVTDGSGTVLHNLIRLHDVELIKTIFDSDRFKDDQGQFLRGFANKKNKQLRNEKSVAPVEVAVNLPNDTGKAQEILELLLLNGAEILPAYEAVMQVSDLKLLDIVLKYMEREQPDNNLV